MKPSLPIQVMAGIGLALVAGCTSRKLSMPTKAGPFVYDLQRLGNKETIKEATFVGADGSSFTLRGFTSDQVEALGVVAESAARGAVQALTGQAGGAGGMSQVPAIANAARNAPAARQTAEPAGGSPVVVAGPDGRSYKLLVRNGVVVLHPTDEVPAEPQRP